MSNLAVSVRGLTKEYRIAHEKERATTMGEALARRARNPLARTRYETFRALDDVSFDVERGEVLGIIGRNGAGKSTLLKVLSRITEPTRGEVRLFGRVGSLLEVGTGFHPELTGRENIFLNGAILGMRRREIEKQFGAIVDFAEVEKFLDTPVKRYSSGMYVRLAFAVAAHLNPEILIVDEVLSVGDAEFQKKCLGKMQDVSRQEGRTVLFVSHNMAAVRELCTSAVLLRAGHVASSGPPSAVASEYFERGSSDAAQFADGPLKCVSVRQAGRTLRVTAQYETNSPITVPALGVVISDVSGIPIFGANPRIYDLPPLAGAGNKGEILLEIRQPILMDGTYRLSAWFGDRDADVVSHTDCLTFTIAGMGGSRQLDRGVVGSIYPTCEWLVSTDGKEFTAWA